METFYAAGKSFALDRTYVMGILNVTPDSFSDGGLYFDPEAAVRRAKEMEREGVDILDIGGQSTRPGSTRISPEEEWSRIEAVVRAAAAETTLAVSVDTFYPGVAEKALGCGAHIINDVTGFSTEMWRAVEKSDCGCIVMHPGDPDNLAGSAGDILETVRAFFERKAGEAAQHGVARGRLCFDPGIGFGKTTEQNFELLANPDRLRIPGAALLMAASRKRVIGAVCGNPPFEQRMAGTIAAHTASVLWGADIVRAHDTFEAVQAARMADALKKYRKD
ncbi:MAG: dihydropteroate synthase [Hominenteromicrobium sp.]